MNKHQKALETIKTDVCEDDENFNCDNCRVKEYCSFYSCCQTFQELIDNHEKLEQKNEKLKEAISILNRIYGFKLQDIKFSGFYELLIPDMTSDELTKEEYELLKEVFEDE